MGKVALAVMVFSALMAQVGAKTAKTTAASSPPNSQADSGTSLNQDYLTSTGETVPRPGVPQSSGPTPLDRTLQQQDKQIDKSICSNC